MAASKEFDKMVKKFLKKSRSTVTEAKARRYAGGKALAKATKAKRRRSKAGNMDM